MKLGDLGSEPLDIGHFIYDIDEVTEKEVNVWIRGIGTPCDGNWSRIWDDLVQGCHGHEFTRHHGFSNIALGHLLIAYSVSFEDSDTRVTYNRYVLSTLMKKDCKEPSACSVWISAVRVQ